MNLKPAALLKQLAARPVAVLLLFAMMLPLLNLAGCASPLYYGQAISGHMTIMRERENITDIIDRVETGAELRRQLKLSIEIRRFASQHLGLPENNSYSQFVATGREAVTWNVLAAPEFSVQAREWCFLVSGCVPYRGYFQLEGARKFASKMEAGSYDVAVSPAIAYSTLGWFEDPLLDTMLNYSDEQLAALLFHELAHQQLYVKGDTSFNESYAEFVEEAGVRLWLHAQGQLDALERWQARENASVQFNALLIRTRDRLAQEYLSGHPEPRMRENKEIIFSDMRKEYSNMVQQDWNGKDYYKTWFSRTLNNAQLALTSSYQGGACAFRSLYQTADRDIIRFHQLAAEKAELDKAERHSWFNMSCTVIASDGNL